MQPMPLLLVRNCSLGGMHEDVDETQLSYQPADGLNIMTHMHSAQMRAAAAALTR